jgi:hypothetical protein
MINAAEMNDPSAAKTRTCPTRRIKCGAICDPPKNPRKYPDITMDKEKVENPSRPPRTPKTEPCNPLPIIKSNMPSNKADEDART